jgi:hypothetical protein
MMCCFYNFVFILAFIYFLFISIFGGGSVLIAGVGVYLGFGRGSSTSFPSGNQVDDLPPAPS